MRGLPEAFTAGFGQGQEACTRRGTGFSRFPQLVSGEGESQTSGEPCVLYFYR
jgi:hypothetical protein